jgi:hypothetical protein
MKKRTAKRPCSICGRWFEPHPRTRWCQKTCGNAACRAAQRSRAQRGERDRNRVEREMWRVGERLDDIERRIRERDQDAGDDGRTNREVLRASGKDSIGVERDVLIELLARLHLKTRKDAIRMQGHGTKRESGRLLSESRKDSMDPLDPPCQPARDARPGRTGCDRDDNDGSDRGEQAP